MLRGPQQSWILCDVCCCKVNVQICFDQLSLGVQGCVGHLISYRYVCIRITYTFVRIEHSATRKKHNVTLGPGQALKVFCLFCPQGGRQRFSCFAG